MPANANDALQPRLMLFTPPLRDMPAFVPQLSEALALADVASVVARLEDADERALVNGIKALAKVTQEHEVALLVDGRPEIVARGGADGAHLTGYEAFAAALDALKPDRIAGCGGLGTRHDAMEAAEDGADYVMFGEPVEGRRPAFETLHERIEWWAQVFEVPCVAYAGALGEVAPLARAGADFVALGDWIWADPRGVAAVLAEVESAISGGAGSTVPP